MRIRSTKTDRYAVAGADFCVMAIPPKFNQGVVERAAARKLPVLSGKPIAHTWQACLAIYALVQAAGLKLAILRIY